MTVSCSLVEVWNVACTGGETVDLLATSVVGSAVDILNNTVVSVGLVGTHGILSTSCWYLGLTLSSCDIHVLSVRASRNSLESIVAGEVVLAGASISDLNVSVGTSSTEWVLASSWNLALALACSRVEVKSIRTVQCGVYSLSTSEVALAEVVADVETVCSSTAEWVDASSWDLGLTLACGCIEVGVGWAAVQLVGTVGTSEVV